MHSQILAFKAAGKMPPGWYAKLDPTSEQQYFYHRDSGTVLWEPPWQVYGAQLYQQFKSERTQLVQQIKKDHQAGQPIPCAPQNAHAVECDDLRVEEL